MAWGPRLHRKEEKREATSTLCFLGVNEMGLTGCLKLLSSDVSRGNPDNIVFISILVTPMMWGEGHITPKISIELAED